LADANKGGIWIILQIRPQPLLDFRNGHSLPLRIILDLVATKLADGKVAGLGGGEVEVGNGAGRIHGQTLGILPITYEQERGEC